MCLRRMRQGRSADKSAKEYKRPSLREASSNKAMYTSERGLVRHFVHQLQSRNCPWGPVLISREFNYLRGRADIVLVAERGEHVIAVEAKLDRWRQALQQAYRNTCFAHSSYVVLPRNAALRAQQYGGDFIFRNVELCYIDGAKITVAIRPERKPPLEPWLFAEALASVGGSSTRGNGRSRAYRTQSMPSARP